MKEKYAWIWMISILVIVGLSCGPTRGADKESLAQAHANPVSLSGQTLANFQANYLGVYFVGGIENKNPCDDDSYDPNYIARGEETHMITTDAAVISGADGTHTYKPIQFEDETQFCRQLASGDYQCILYNTQEDGRPNYTIRQFSLEKNGWCSSATYFMDPPEDELAEEEQTSAGEEDDDTELAEEQASEQQPPPVVDEQQNEPAEENQDEAETGESSEDRPFNLSYNGPGCPEGEEFPYEWGVNLLQGDGGNVVGTIRFHDCNGDGGQVIYHVTGQVSDTTSDTVDLSGNKKDAWGNMEDRGPQTITFTVTLGQPPYPNLLH